MGIALWTQVQAALFLPPLALVSRYGPRRLGRAACLLAGMALGYLPVWLPRIAPLAVGPPGAEGTGYRPALESLLDAAAIERARWIVQGALTARRDLFARGNGPEALCLMLTLALVSVAVVVWIRPGCNARPGKPARPRWGAPSPALATTPLRFWSGDRIGASGRGVARFPEAAAAVECARRSWILQVRRRSAGVGSDSPGDRLVLTERQIQGSPEVEEAYRRVEGPRTLFPHYEPYPPFPIGWNRSDWRGWPPRRDPRLFDHIVWLSRLAQREGLRDSINLRLEEMVNSGEWGTAAQWPSGRILERLRRSGPRGKRTAG